MLTLRRRATRDPVEEQLRDIARQGTAMARIAHLFAFLLLVLFSLASLVALAGDALRHFLASWQAGQLDVPSGISIVVSTLLVPAMDFSMFYAAMMVRNLRARHAGRAEQAIHWIVIAVVTLGEGSTYIYMAAIYEHPQSMAEWAIIVFRGFTSSLLSIYLAMARPLPVTPRDILAQTELAAGAGVIRDVTVIANDATAPLADKMMLYDASALMNQRDRDRLGRMISVAQLVATRSAVVTDTVIDAPISEEDGAEFELSDAMSSNPSRDDAEDDGDEGPKPPENDPNSPHNPPRGKRAVRQDSAGADAYSSKVLAQPANNRQAAAAVKGSNPTPKASPNGSPKKPAKPARSDAGMSQETREELHARRVAAARSALRADPAISVGVLAKRIALATQHRISESTAHGIMTELQGRKPRSRTGDAATAAKEVMEANGASGQ